MWQEMCKKYDYDIRHVLKKTQFKLVFNLSSFLPYMYYTHAQNHVEHYCEQIRRT